MASLYQVRSSCGYLLEHLEYSGTIMRRPIVHQCYSWEDRDQRQRNKEISRIKAPWSNFEAETTI